MMRAEVELIIVVGIVIIVFNAIPKRKATLRSDRQSVVRCDTPVLRSDDE